MCPDCELAVDVFEAARKNHHLNYYPALLLMEGMAQGGRLELYAGDCPVREVPEHLFREDHYTICHYYRCTGCGQMYFIGACVRGRPIFRRLDSLDGINWNNMLWGREGTRFG